MPAKRSSSMTPSSVLRSRLASADAGSRRRATQALQRQATSKRAPPRSGVEHLDAALVHLDELLRDRQPQAGAAGRAVDAAVALPEALEDRLPQLGLHARPGVVDRDRRAPAAEWRSEQRMRPPSGTNLKALPSRFITTRCSLSGIDRGDARRRRRPTA